MYVNYDDRPAGSPPPVESPTYATRVPGRRPEWKFHTAIGPARGALAVRRFGNWQGIPRELWHFADGAWALVETRETVVGRRS